jgi:hypothetical protein
MGELGRPDAPKQLPIRQLIRLPVRLPIRLMRYDFRCDADRDN